MLKDLGLILWKFREVGVLNVNLGCNYGFWRNLWGVVNEEIIWLIMGWFIKN